jgi:hypothetical protein
METIYWVNGKPLKWTELIELAWKHGYENDGLSRTSEAARVLRECGMEVEEKP